MTDLKRLTPKFLLWLDMEMTGLKPATDRIVEVGVILTDWNFAELGQFESGVGQAEAELREKFAANPWATARPAETEELITLSLAAPAEAEVEQQVINLIDKIAGKDAIVLLAGNSIHQDRQFVRAWWPKLEQRLHYRMLDVSAFKVVMQAKYGLEFPKKETHRALGDIQESIAELQFYLKELGK